MSSIGYSFTGDYAVTWSADLVGWRWVLWTADGYALQQAVAAGRAFTRGGARRQVLRAIAAWEANR